MQPMKYLAQWLSENADQRYLFRTSDLRSIFPELSDSNFKTLLSRVVQAGLLIRICRGLYFYKKNFTPDGLILFHIATIIRPNEFNYISLETALSDAGVISQIPINCISIMSSGRSSIISCGDFGNIEFVHTNQKPLKLVDEIVYDNKCGMWRAKVNLALRDMKATHRNCDLINWDIANELI